MKKEKTSFLHLAKSRKTCYEFSDKQLSDKDLNYILEAGRWAPSFSNVQPGRFKVITNKKIIKELMDLVVYGGFHTSPPLLVAIVLPSNLMGGDHRGIKYMKMGFIDATLSVAMSVQNMVLAATDLSINSAILTPEYERSKEILGLDSNDQLSLLVALGYEKKGAFQKKRHRIEMKNILLKGIK